MITWAIVTTYIVIVLGTFAVFASHVMQWESE